MGNPKLDVKTAFVTEKSTASSDTVSAMSKTCAQLNNELDKLGAKNDAAKIQTLLVQFQALMTGAPESAYPKEMKATLTRAVEALGTLLEATAVKNQDIKLLTTQAKEAIKNVKDTLDVDENKSNSFRP